MFGKNIGGTERVVRVVAGLAIMSLMLVGPKTPWALLGAVPAFTGIIGWCPPYAMLGLSTCGRCKDNA